MSVCCSTRRPPSFGCPSFWPSSWWLRGLPALVLYRKELPRPQRVPLALFSATGLPLIVVITDLGIAQGRMIPENAAALVGAGMLSVLLLPMLGLNRLRRSGLTIGTGTGMGTAGRGDEHL